MSPGMPYRSRYASFWPSMPPPRFRAPFHIQYRYLSYFFGNPVGVTICVREMRLPLILPEISGFACPRLCGKEEKYVSTAGRPASEREGHHPRAVGTGDQASEGSASPSGLGAVE